MKLNKNDIEMLNMQNTINKQLSFLIFCIEMKTKLLTINISIINIQCNFLKDNYKLNKLLSCTTFMKDLFVIIFLFHNSDIRYNGVIVCSESLQYSV